MTPKQLKSLRSGDIVKGIFSGQVFIVTGNYGDRVTAVKTVDITGTTYLFFGGSQHDSDRIGIGAGVHGVLES